MSPRAVSKQKQEHSTRIVVDGIELAVTQIGGSVSIKRKIGRDRKRKLDVTSSLDFSLADHRDEEAIALIRNLKSVANYRTARCTCDYRYGFSDHADHCQSIYVASYDGGCDDDD